MAVANTAEMFWDQVDKEGSDDCWPFTGTTHNPNTGDVVVRIEAPEDFADSVTIYLNDTEVFD